MSIRTPEGNELPSTPEDASQYRYGDYYFHLKALLQQARRFTGKAFFPYRDGIHNITNQNTANGSIRIVEGKNLREPDDSDQIFFSKDLLESIGINPGRLKARRDADHYDPEQTGVYRKIDPDVLKRIMNEAPLPKNEKKTG